MYNAIILRISLVKGSMIIMEKKNEITLTFNCVNQISVVKTQCYLDKPPSTFKQSLFYHYFTDSSLKSVMS